MYFIHVSLIYITSLNRVCLGFNLTKNIHNILKTSIQSQLPKGTRPAATTMVLSWGVFCLKPTILRYKASTLFLCKAQAICYIRDGHPVSQKLQYRFYSMCHTYLYKILRISGPKYIRTYEQTFGLAYKLCCTPCLRAMIT